MTVFSIITPVFNPPIEAFRDCIDSVFRQEFKDWEWIVVDDSSTNSLVIEELSRLAKNPKVKLIRRAKNGGIVAASNDALSVAAGSFIVLLDHDDQLTENALFENHRVIASQPLIDYVYSDEDKIDETGRTFGRFRKPRWSPERLRSQNYCCHLSVLRTELVRTVGGFREGYDGSQDYDLILRVTEQARAVAHIPKVLYHWRTVVGSTAADPQAKPYALSAAKRAVEEHYLRVGISASVEITNENYLRTRRVLNKKPLVSIVIPTCGAQKRIWGREMILVETTVASILQRSTYENYEIIVIYDDPRTPSTVLDQLRAIGGDKLTLLPYKKPFNFSEKCNIGAIHAKGEVLLLMNDDTQVNTPEWIERMIAFLDEPDVGMVGPLLLLEDGRIQSAGHFNNDGPSNVAFAHSTAETGPFGTLRIAGERSGLTMACVAIPIGVFRRVGGLSMVYPRSFNDVDFGNKLWMLGYRMVWTPDVQISHFESATRNPTVAPREFHHLMERWSCVVRQPDDYLPYFQFHMSGVDH